MNKDIKKRDSRTAIIYAGWKGGDPTTKICEICPECKFPGMLIDWKYCPGCGVKIAWDYT